MAEIAVAGVDEQRRADVAFVDEFLHGTVAVVVAAHKADLYQTAAASHFGFDDLHAVIGRGREGLFTEYVLACFDACEHQRRMEFIGGAYNDRIDFGVVDEVHAILIELHAVLVGHLAAAFFKNIGHSDHLGRGDPVGQTANVVAAHAAAADYTNIQHNDLFSFRKTRAFSKSQNPVFSSGIFMIAHPRAQVNNRRDILIKKILQNT